MTSTTTAVADLLPAAPEPDRTETVSLEELAGEMYDSGMGPLAEFQGIGYALGVYLLEWQDAQMNVRRACAVAPTYVGGPPSAMATADVRYFEFDVWDLQPLAYARACLWALRETAIDAERETRA
jgi:expansin (peptidoglycan-binding protein)